MRVAFVCAVTRALIKRHKHLPLVERRLGRTRIALDEARVTKVGEPDAERRAAAAAVDVEEIG